MMATIGNERPSKVVAFEKLMYLSFAMGLVIVALDGPRLAAKPEAQGVGGLSFLIVVGVMTMLLLMLLVWLIARRRKNWARWLLAILTIVGLPLSYGSLGETLSANMIAGLISIGQGIAQLIAIVLIFTGNAVPWFKTKVGETNV